MSDIFAGMERIRHNWSWFLILGILQIVLGILAIVFSGMATLSLILILGWFLLISGVASVISAFYARQWSGFFLLLFGGIVDIVLGCVFIGRPLASALSLTLLLATFFIVSGIFRLIGAFTWHLPHWGWEALGDIVTVALGVLLWRQWPTSAVWFLGFAIGIDLIFRGWAWISLALMMHGNMRQPAWFGRLARY